MRVNTSFFLDLILLALFQVIFHYIGYNESGRRVDSTYQQGRPAKSRLGIKAMIPGLFLKMQITFRVGILNIVMFDWNSEAYGLNASSYEFR